MPRRAHARLKHKFSTCKLYIIGCSVFTRKRDRELSKIVPKASVGEFVGFTEGEHVHLVYVQHTQGDDSSRSDRRRVQSGLNP